VSDLAVNFNSLGFEAPQPTGKFRVINRDQAAFDRLVHAGDPRVEISLVRE
jgi:hypothetical protein